MKFNFNVSIYQVLFSLSLIIFAIYKWQFIDLPLYWDEAWVYGPAVEEMVNNGVSLSPLAIRPEYSRGHPLLFHAIVAIWLKAFGVSVSTMHSFMLFISLITFGFLFALIRLISDERAAFFGVCFVMLQPTIIEQSGQLYPEMSLALATVAACYFYYKRSFWVYFTCATAAIMIKESGIVVIIAVSLFHFISMRRSKETVLNSIQKSIKYLTPLLIWFIYLGSLKITYGWFLFPEHIGLISFNPLIVWDKIEGYFVFVFIYHGSNFLITAGLLLIIYSIYKKKKLTFIIPFQIWMLVLFLVGFIVFGALNFYSSRYMTVAFLIYAVLFSTIIFSLNQHKWLLPLMVVILFGIQFELLKNKVR